MSDIFSQKLDLDDGPFQERIGLMVFDGTTTQRAMSQDNHFMSTPTPGFQATPDTFEGDDTLYEGCMTDGEEDSQESYNRENNMTREIPEMNPFSFTGFDNTTSPNYTLVNSVLPGVSSSPLLLGHGVANMLTVQQQQSGHVMSMPAPAHSALAMQVLPFAFSQMPDFQQSTAYLYQSPSHTTPSGTPTTEQLTPTGVEKAGPQTKKCMRCDEWVYFLKKSTEYDKARVFACGHFVHNRCLLELGIQGGGLAGSAESSWVQRGFDWQDPEGKQKARGCCPECHAGCTTHSADGKTCKPCSAWRTIRKGNGNRCNALAQGKCENHCHMQHQQIKPPRDRKEKRMLNRAKQVLEGQLKEEKKNNQELKAELQHTKGEKETMQQQQQLRASPTGPIKSDKSQAVVGQGRGSVQSLTDRGEWWTSLTSGVFDFNNTLLEKKNDNGQPRNTMSAVLPRAMSSDDGGLSLKRTRSMTVASLPHRNTEITFREDLNPHPRDTPEHALYRSFLQNSSEGTIVMQDAIQQGLSEDLLNHYIEKQFVGFRPRKLPRRTTSSGEASDDKDEVAKRRDTELCLKALGPTFQKRCDGSEDRRGCGETDNGAYGLQAEKSNFWCIECWRKHFSVNENRTDFLKESRSGSRRKLEARLREVKDQGGLLEIPTKTFDALDWGDQGDLEVARGIASKFGLVHGDSCVSGQRVFWAARPDHDAAKALVGRLDGQLQTTEGVENIRNIFQGMISTTPEAARKFATTLKSLAALVEQQ